eukprot:jgi/Botrbrau1/1384/Bobra.0063s0084.1
MDSPAFIFGIPSRHSRMSDSISNQSPVFSPGCLIIGSDYMLESHPSASQSQSLVVDAPSCFHIYHICHICIKVRVKDSAHSQAHDGVVPYCCFSQMALPHGRMADDPHAPYSYITDTLLMPLTHISADTASPQELAHIRLYTIITRHPLSSLSSSSSASSSSSSSASLSLSSSSRA